MKNTIITFHVYKITNISNNKISIGVTKLNSTNIEDDYDKYQSQLKASIIQSGIKNFKKEILISYHDKTDAMNEASRIRTKIYNINKSNTLSKEEKQHIFDNNIFDKRKTPSIDDKKKYHKDYYNKNKQKMLEGRRKYKIENKDKITDYKIKNRDKINRQARQYYHTVGKFREKDPTYHKKWKLENKEKIVEYFKNYYLNRKKEISETKIKEGNNGDDWTFYTLKFTHKIEKFEFFKYGVTSTSIHHRFNNGGYTDFDYEIINYELGSKEYINALEFLYLTESKEDMFIFPKDIEFGGKTECRTKLIPSINIV